MQVTTIKICQRELLFVGFNLMRTFNIYIQLYPGCRER